MTKSKYLTAPIPSTKMPGGIPYILSNEAFERFSFYGMRCILVVFMTKYLMGSGGDLEVLSKEESNAYLHFFVSAVYFTPILSAFISGIWLGKFKTIMIFSVINCLGLLALVIDDTRVGLTVGLALIAIGSGFIKPCVSANVGDQFGKTNKHLMAKVYSWFYFAINFGSCFSYLLIPVLLEKFGPRVAFSVPAVSMLLATCSYWVGRKNLVHVPAGGVKFIKETFSRDGVKAIGKLSIIYVFMAMFWALFDQMDSSWIQLAGNMNPNWLGHKWLAPQIMSSNPLMIMALIPIFSFAIYPAINKVFPLTPLRKISIGMFVAASAFVVPAWIEMRIGAGQTPCIAWLIVACMILTAAEVMVSITVLEFSYTQAPKELKSFIMAVSLLSISLGNIFTGTVNLFIQNEDGSSKLAGASYFWFFAGMMLLTAIIFVPVAALYKEKTYILEEATTG